MHSSRNKGQNCSNTQKHRTGPKIYTQTRRAYQQNTVFKLIWASVNYMCQHVWTGIDAQIRSSVQQQTWSNLCSHFLPMISFEITNFYGLLFSFVICIMMHISNYMFHVGLFNMYYMILFVFVVL